MMLYGVRFLLNLFEMLIYRRFLEAYIGNRRTGLELSVLIMGICAGISSFVNSLGNPVCNLLNTVMILWLFSLQYRAAGRSRIFAVLIYVGINFVTEPIGYVLHMAVVGVWGRDEMVSYFLLAFILEMLRLTVVEIFCRKKTGKKLSFSMLPRTVAGLFCCIPFTSIVCCILLIEIAKRSISGELVVLCLAVIFTIFICNYLVFLMMEKYTEVIEKRREEEMDRQKAAYKEEYYRELEVYVDKINAVRHDMKNQLLAVYDTTEEQGSSGARRMIEGMLQDIRTADEEVYSSNPVLNSILKVKAGKARQHDIEIGIETFVPKKILVADGDMGILFGNLFDNAIEACDKMEQGKKYIHFQLKYQSGNLLLHMKNSKRAGNNAKLQTEKTDTRKHGRGLRSVKRTAEKYGGSLFLEDKGDLFETKLMLTGIAKTTGLKRPENFFSGRFMSYLGRLVSKTVINGKNKVYYLQTTENCCKKEETIMKKKYFACAMGLVLALSLAACGEEEVVVENTNEEVTQEVQTQEVQTQEVAEAPTETVAETGTEAEGGPLLQVAVMEIPDLSGTEWNFAGGMIDGVEMEEEDLNATLETYGGTLQLVFGEDGAVTMVQGGGNAEGTYEYSDDNTAIKMTLDFGGTEVTYAGFLSEVGDTVTLIAMSDMNGYDGLYFVQ